MIKYAELSPEWQQAGLEKIDFRPLLELLDLQIEKQLDRSWESTNRDAPDILDIAYDTQHRLSTDPRDKIFGLAGITSDMVSKAHFDCIILKYNLALLGSSSMAPIKDQL
ncbi:hypothetical protein PV05_01323 [Exophiala xenobiotica]|uniref:Uncharacterized protein n=1 Tax=Exophiala xenobiotica TaxID=348802 RepID=A0A0D2C897_9EURO|nr:uncharacterized protein PV05_01323 [Exophiala xenobiotica]KIW61166.1 hypothetical protein PV05_01323 [Exophiala xenobiotica]